MPCFEDRPIARVELAPLSQRAPHHTFYPVLTPQPSHMPAGRVSVLSGKQPRVHPGLCEHSLKNEFTG
jgi:hypothetical protein